MSASVAMSAVGLLDRPFTPPSDPRESRVAEWHDHMEVDRSSQEQTTAGQDEPQRTRVRRSTSGAQSGDERRNVLSGLLAALATNSTDVQIASSGNQDHEHRSVTPPQDSPISQTSPSASLVPPEESATVDATTTATAAITTITTFTNDTITTATDPNDVRLPAMQNPNIVPTLTADQTDLLNLTTTAALDNIPIPAFEMPTEPIPHTPTSNQSPINIKRQYDAFARLEFDDGIFYLNTYQCELGRDQHAYHIALQREREAQEAAQQAKNHSDSSRGRASQISNIIKAESQIQGSVVSEAGGFAGVDEQPVEGYGTKQNGQPGHSRGSPSSDASIVRPADVLHNPSLHAPFDYNKEASRQFAPPAPPIEKPVDEDEQPAPITADHLPDPNSCPLIPIHVTSESETTELDGLKAISRRHMKIFWSWENSSFMLEILGRNGAFLEGEFVAPSEVVPLYTGANIQISSVNFVFRLPHIEAASPSIESMSNIDELLEASPINLSEGSDSGQKGKLKLKLNVDPSGAQTVLTNGESRRRGPGRPPKDGVMSQRERKEREKADKEAKTRALNGDPSPPAPPVPQRKASKSQLPKPEQIAEPVKPEKRKYNKRKREDGEEEQVLPSIEATDDTPLVETTQNQPVAKKARTKSYSPPYKPREECSQADLARPAHNYAVLLYQVLSQTGEISLRQIYKEMQSRWPYFKYIVESDGWTSSVRHNLNQEVDKLFLKGRKEGKGFTWLAKPNAMEEYQAQKNKRSNAPSAPRPRPPPPRANYPPGSGQQLTWQNSGPAPQPNGTGNALPHPGQWDPQQNGQSRPGQPLVNGQPHTQGQMPNPHGPNPNVQDIEAPTPAHMIVTFLGVRIIDKFENTMMSQLRARFTNDEERLNQWSAVFRSARARCLNGSPASSLPEGETEDERTIMTHINNFVSQYKNPAFRGFHAGMQPAGVNPNNPNLPVPNNTANSKAMQLDSNQPLIAQAGPNTVSNNTVATPSQQSAPSSAPIPATADSHSHPLPSPNPEPEASNAQPNVFQPAQVASGTSNGNVYTTASTAIPSGSAVITATATVAPPASAPVPLKDTSPIVTSAAQPASPFSGSRPVPAIAVDSGPANRASSNSVLVPTNTQPRPESAPNDNGPGAQRAFPEIGNKVTTATSQEPRTTAKSPDQPRSDSLFTPSKTEPTDKASNTDLVKEEPVKEEPAADNA